MSGSLEARLRRLEAAAEPEPLTDGERVARVRAIFIAAPDSERAQRIRAILEGATARADRAARSAS